MKKIIIYLLTASFLIGGIVYAKKLDSNLEDLHFGAQDPTNSSMPSNLELARPWIFNWNKIESEEGKIKWKKVDKQYKALQNTGYTTLGVIIPFAEWDQTTCHNDACKTQYFEADKVGLEYVCNPCQWKKYKKFVRKLVERYDGDGKKDMKKLSIPIKAWEVWNEPEFDNYYIGDAADYAHLLKVTYKSIKKADKKATVLNGGIASVGDTSLNFWKKVFNEKNSGKSFIDAVSLHCISCGNNNTMNIADFNTWAEEKNLQNKPIWLTELEYGSLTDDEAAPLIVESLAYAFAHNVDKVFFVEFEYYLSEYTKSKAALELLRDKLANFSEASVNTEFMDSDNDNVDTGVYEFQKDDGQIIIAWGGGTLAVGGNIVSVVDIYGNDIEVENNLVDLVETPYIIETN